VKLYIDIDMKKAVSQMPSVGIDTPREDQSVAEYQSSYAHRPVGVAAGEENDPDDPEVGASWKHSGSTEVDATRARQKQRTAEAKADGVVKAQPFDGGFTSEESQRIAESLNLDFSKEKFGLGQFRTGVNAEREHGDVSQSGEVLGKIALVHLREDPEYYKKLKKIEKSVGILKSLNARLSQEKAVRTPNPREQEFLRDVLGYPQDSINKGHAVITGRSRRLFTQWLCDRLCDSTTNLMKSVGATFGC